MAIASSRLLEPGSRLVNQDLSGADLSGRVVSDLAMVHCSLRGCDLRRATLSRVDLSLSDLGGAFLDGATLEYVNAAGALLTAAHARGLRVEHTKLARADFSAADLRGTAFSCVDLEGAVLRAANLADASITYSNCTAAAFDEALLKRLNAIGSTFRDACFVGARSFFQSHEIVAEVLRGRAGDDFERLRSVGAILLDRSRCYAEWRGELDTLGPDQRRFALEVFAAYPESGCAEALEHGWAPSVTD